MDDDIPVEIVRGLAGPDRRHYSKDARAGWGWGSAQSLSRGGRGKGEGVVGGDDRRRCSSSSKERKGDSRAD